MQITIFKGNILWGDKGILFGGRADTREKFCGRAM